MSAKMLHELNINSTGLQWFCCQIYKIDFGLLVLTIHETLCIYNVGFILKNKYKSSKQREECRKHLVYFNKTVFRSISFIILHLTISF